jgi:hypothetical protein
MIPCRVNPKGAGFTGARAGPLHGAHAVRDSVKHCLDFSFVFSSPLPAWRNLISASGVFCGGRWQPGCTGIFWSAAYQPTALGTGLKSRKGLYSGVRPFSYRESMSDEFQVLRLTVVLDPPFGYGFVNGAARWQAINLASYTATHTIELTRIAHVWGYSYETNVWKSSKISIFPLRIQFKLWWQHLEASQSLRPKYSKAHLFQFFCIGRLQNLLQVSSKCLIYSHEHVRHYDTFKQHTSTAMNK